MTGLHITGSGLDMKVQARFCKRFLSIRRLSSYRKAIQILAPNWHTPMQPVAESQRLRKFFANGSINRKGRMFPLI